MGDTGIVEKHEQIQHNCPQVSKLKTRFITFHPLITKIATLEVYVCIACLRDNKTIVWMLYDFADALGYPH